MRAPLLATVRHVRPARVRAGSGAILVLALLATGVALACSRGPVPGASPTAAVASPVPVETAAPPVIATEPPPTPTPTVTPAAASAASIVNRPPVPFVFPTPPPMLTAPPPSSSGIARLQAPRLGLDHYIEVVRVVDNQMQAPADGSYAVGWYPEYSRPGLGENTIFTAHETWNHFQGPFYSLRLAQAGDDVFVAMTDGQRYRYRVISKTRYEVDTMPMVEIIWPTTRPANEEWLTLLTCGGRIVYDATGFGEYLDRDVVVAKRVE